MLDFDKYFLKECQIFLVNIKYEVINLGNAAPDVKLMLKDEISSCRLDDMHIKVEIKRNIRFEPESLYDLSVTFGAILTHNMDTRDEVNWNEYDLSKELKECNNGLIVNIISRISMQISQITSSYGQNPIITPPTIVQ